MAPPSESTAVAKREQIHPIVAALEERSDAIASLLPRGVDVERFKRIVLQSINRNPDLRKCSPASIVDAAAEAARLGLEPSGAIGGAHLVPYGNKAQLIVDYRGLVELARRSGEIAAIDAAVVRRSDRFAVRRGTEPSIDHVQDLEASTPADPSDEANPVTHVYAVARLRNGQRQFDVMSFEEIERIRGRSRAGNAGPWRTDWHEMAKKTVLRRLSKTLPLTVEVRAFIEMEDEAERTPVVVVDGGRSDRMGGLRGALRQRAAALAPDQQPAPRPVAVVAEATVADAARPTRSRKRAPEQPEQEQPSDTGKGTPPTAGQPPAPVQTEEPPPAQPPDTDEALEAATFEVANAAAAHGLDATWPAIDALAHKALGKDPATMSAADWLALRDRIAAGEFSS
jgi:recombination protein RecT